MIKKYLFVLLFLFIGINLYATQVMRDDVLMLKTLSISTSTAAPSTHQEGRMYWDNVDHTLAIQTGLSDTNLQVGQESVIRVINKTGNQITNGSIVYEVQRVGDRPSVALALANSTTTAKILGMATEDINNDAEGFITTFGLVRGVNTSAYSGGQTLYLSSYTAGGFTGTTPPIPNYSVKIGRVSTNQNNGSVFVDLGVECTNHVVINNLAVLGNTYFQGKLVEGVSTTQILYSTSTIQVSNAYVVIQSSGGIVALTSNPQITTTDIEDGTIIDIWGNSDTNIITLIDGNGLKLNEDITFTLGLDDVISFKYRKNSNLWCERFRANN